MIALAGYQFTEFRRGRYWPALLAGYLIYLVLFYLGTARHHPGSYAAAAFGPLLIGFGLGWALVAGQHESHWRIVICSGGGRERVQLSRILLAFLMMLPLAGLTVLVAAGHRLVSDSSPVPTIGALLLFLVAGLLGCVLGCAGARSFGPRSIPVQTVVVCLLLLIAL